MLKRRSNNGKFAFMLVALVAGMVGLSYASVPLYKLFCQVTGYGGTPITANAERSSEVSDETIKVRFDSNVSPKLKWRFKPLQREVAVKLGDENLAFFEAENLSAEALTGRAIFNVTPFKAGPYFVKIECFCFTEQTLEPGQVVSMPVQYYVDPDIYEDLDPAEISTITLSYTFFPHEDDGEEKDGEDKINVSARTVAPNNG